MSPRRLATVPLIALTVLAGAGCEIGIGIGTGLHDDRFRDLEGRYEGSFVLEFDPVGGVGDFDEDPGTIEITRRHGRGFSGDWRWFLDGRRLSGRLEDGRDEFGGIVFELETDFGEDLLEAVTGCRFRSGERRFHGRLSGRRLHAERIARLLCRDRFGRLRDVRFRLSFSGHRDRLF